MLITNNNKTVRKNMDKILKDDKLAEWVDKNQLFQTADTESEEYWRNIICEDMKKFYS